MNRKSDFFFQATVALSNSCEVSRSTVQVVDSCPDSEEKWKEAAARKNCYANSSQCSEPTRLVYHCVINPYVNQTLEVCAYAQNIVQGTCKVLFKKYFYLINCKVLSSYASLPQVERNNN